MKYLNKDGAKRIVRNLQSEVNTKIGNKSDGNHTHGNITNDGQIGTASGKPLITTTGGSITTGMFGTSAGTFCQGNDSRLSDSRNPTAHTHSASDITSGLATVATSGSYNDLSNKPTTMTPTSHTHGNITNDGKIGSNANKPLITTTGGTVTTGSFGTTANTFCEGNDSRLSDARTPTAHTHVKSEITDFPSLATVATSGSYNDLSNKPTIPTVNNATLTIQKNGTTVKTFTANASTNATANITVPTKVSELDNDSNYLTSVPNLDASKITSGTIDIARLPQGALERLVTVTNKTARFALTASTVQVGDVVKQTDTGVMYYVVDTSELNSEDGYSEFTAGTATSVPWSGVTGKPSSYTPASHTHGNITNAGAVGTTANKPLITTTNGVITTGSFGTTANTFCQGNDSRLSDARTPTAHTHSASDITSGLAAVATSGSYNDLSNKPTIPTVNNATLTIQKNGTTVKTFTANASSNVTANITVPTKTSDLTNDSHVSITTETDTTSTDTPTHGGTFTCIDSVTRDSNGHVTTVNTKTVTLPADKNTDTNVTQNVSTANENHPILLSVTKDATANQGAKTSIFASGVKVNPSTNTVTATTFSGALSGNASTATQFSANKSVTLTGDVTGTASSKAGWSVATTLADSGVTAGTYGPSADVTGNNNATISVPEITVDAKGRITSVVNRTLTCKNNTYSVYNKTLTIQKNGTNVATFTSNSNTDVTANITVPTKTSELTNDSGYLTSHQSLANYVTLNSAQTISATKNWTKTQSFKNTSLTNHKANPSADTELWACQFLSNDSKYWGGLGHKYFTTGVSEVQIAMSNWTTSGTQGFWHLDFGATKDFSSVYFCPSINNTVNLGTSGNKWRTLNGINPGALGLPNFNAGITLDTTNWDKTGKWGADANFWTPTLNGWLTVLVNGTPGTGWVQLSQADNLGQFSVCLSTGYAWATIPVVANWQCKIALLCSTVSAKFFPCQGNV